ncbi:ATP-binding protein [Halobacteria archaeon AArc-curdl1]|uniref:histidine kinase n=1 Tax=Natronosalvus hydrolyticus TaxID=2979988 RepID=A0AAP2Z6F7_9EURY|nr:ATP-binding protein [Halobacteria archaeon AArc-curdl1]
MEPWAVWEWQYTPYTLVLLGGGAMMAAISVFAWRNRDVTGASSFAVLAGATALWSAAYALQIAAATPELTAFWANVNHIGVAMVPVAWVYFALQFTARERWITHRSILALSVVPVVYVGLVWTNGFHFLVRDPIDLQPVADGTLLVSQHGFGPAFWFHAAYGYGLMLVGFLLLAHLLLWSPRVYRRQVAILLFGALLAVLTNVAFHLGLGPAPYVDLTPFSFVVSGVIFFVAIYRYRLFDLTPIARPLVLDTLHEGIIVVNMDRRIVDSNRSADRLLDIDSRLVIGHRFERLPMAQHTFVDDDSDIDPLTSQSVGTIADETTRETDNTIDPETTTLGSQSFPIKGVMILQDGDEHRYLEVTSRVVADVGGKALGWSLTFRDVTETRRLQAEIEATLEQLRRSNDELDSFASVVSHDLREPLRTTERYLSMLEGTHDSALDEDGADLLEVAHRNTRHAQAMIDDLLTYSRTDGGNHSFDAIDCETLLEELCTTLQFEIEDRDATVDVGTLPTVYGVEHLLRRLFQNLLTNALEYAGDEPPEITVRGEYTDDGVRITVSDTGVGIDPAHANHVFELFNRGDRTDTDGGTGMGLAICQKIAAVHDGSISLESTPAMGTTFTVDLPSESSAETAGASTRNPYAAQESRLEEEKALEDHTDADHEADSETGDSEVAPDNSIGQ